MNTLTEKQELFDCYSDMYKDLNGFRPRGAWLNELGVDELRKMVDDVCRDLAEVIADEAWQAEQDAIDARAEAEYMALDSELAVEADDDFSPMMCGSSNIEPFWRHK